MCNVDEMKKVEDIVSWSPTGVVEALVVDDHAVARARSVQMVFRMQPVRSIPA